MTGIISLFSRLFQSRTTRLFPSHDGGGTAKPARLKAVIFKVLASTISTEDTQASYETRAKNTSSVRFRSCRSFHCWYFLSAFQHSAWRNKFGAVGLKQIYCYVKVLR